jgi:hypothetical protein
MDAVTPLSTWLRLISSFPATFVVNWRRVWRVRWQVSPKQVLRCMERRSQGSLVIPPHWSPPPATYSSSAGPASNPPKPSGPTPHVVAAVPINPQPTVITLRSAAPPSGVDEVGVASRPPGTTRSRTPRHRHRRPAIRSIPARPQLPEFPVARAVGCPPQSQAFIPGL